MCTTTYCILFSVYAALHICVALQIYAALQINAALEKNVALEMLNFLLMLLSFSLIQYICTSICTVGRFCWAMSEECQPFPPLTWHYYVWRHHLHLTQRDKIMTPSPSSYATWQNHDVITSFLRNVTKSWRHHLLRTSRDKIMTSYPWCYTIC